VAWEAPPIGTPTVFASAGVTGSGSTFTTTTTATITSGNLTVVGIAYVTTFAGTLSSVSDGTNSYTKVNGVNPTGTFHVEIWYKTGAAAVASGATITATNGSTVASNRAYIFGVQASNITAFDTSTATCGAATPALGQVNELAIGFGGATTTSLFYTPPTSWSNLAYSGMQSAAGGAVDTLSNINLTNKNGMTYSLGSGLSGTTGCVLAMFKGN
jgi:hypothetical protein